MSRPLAPTALALFFAFGTLMSCLAGLMLLLPGSPLETLWTLNPQAREGLVAMGISAVILMFLICAACATTAVGLWRLRRWGLLTALVILVISLIGDTTRAFLLHDYRTLLGIPIAALMIGYLVTHRNVFI